MRHLSRYPGAPMVLCVILRFSDHTILPLMEDTILEVRAIEHVPVVFAGRCHIWRSVQVLLDNLTRKQI